jgi:hypothetical protein
MSELASAEDSTVSTDRINSEPVSSKRICRHRCFDFNISEQILRIISVAINSSWISIVGIPEGHGNG